MTPHLQTIFGGFSDTIPGNCMQTAVAALLEVEVARVPHFALFGPQWRVSIALYLDSIGKRLTVFSDIGDERTIWGDVAYVADLDMRPTNELLIASGDSTNIAGGSHVVLWRGTELIHDVHPLQRGLASAPWEFWQVTDA